VYTRMFSLACILIWGALFAAVICIVWWGTGHFPGPVYRAAIGVLAGFAAVSIESDLARRHARRKRLPSTSHRKTSTGGAP
jgi:hypothetical protein